MFPFTGVYYDWVNSGSGCGGSLWCIFSSENIYKNTREAASFLGVLSVENGKRNCTSHQGVSRNVPWERLASTHDT